jgi:hypothetical protein
LFCIMPCDCSKGMTWNDVREEYNGKRIRVVGFGSVAIKKNNVRTLQAMKTATPTNTKVLLVYKQKTSHHEDRRSYSYFTQTLARFERGMQI